MTAIQYGGAKTIDEVIQQMDEIIAWSLAEKSRMGYFAALYRKVTVQVRDGIRNNYFEDGERMERLDVIFANRYLNAFEAYRTGKPASRAWELAFDQALSNKPLILQHLLLGMNAHINLDLGIAAAETCPGASITGLHDDFNKINDVLAALVDEVRAEVDSVSPWIKLLDHISPKASDAIVNFSMQKARDAAWDFATKLAAMPADKQAGAIQHRDGEMTLLGELVARPPGTIVTLGLWVIRMRESSNVVRNIKVLNQSGTVAVPAEHKVTAQS